MKRKHPTNLFVRDCITKALFKLMKSTNYNEITVSALVREAGVSRNSFYRNFQSIEDILWQHLIEQTEQWLDGYMVHLHPNVIEEIFRNLLTMQDVRRASALRRPERSGDHRSFKEQAEAMLELAKQEVQSAQYARLKERTVSEGNENEVMEMIPASNEGNAVLARTFDECREGQQLCC